MIVHYEIAGKPERHRILAVRWLVVAVVAPVVPVDVNERLPLGRHRGEDPVVRLHVVGPARADPVDQAPALVGQVEADDLELVLHVRVKPALRGRRRSEQDRHERRLVLLAIAQERRREQDLARAGIEDRQVGPGIGLFAPEAIELRELVGLERQAAAL